MSNPKSIALCRVSTLDQAQFGNSLGRQEYNVQKAAEELSAPILRIWSLDQSSKTGKNLKRRDLAEMLDLCKVDHSIRYLIVDEVDRFMRSIDELYYFEVTFRQVGVTVWYASQPELNNKDPMAKLSKLLKVYQAEASNEERINKSTSGLKARVRLGYYPFPVPQGYRKTGEAGLFEPDEPRFSQLRGAFYEVLSGIKPAEALRNLNALGYRMAGGKHLYLNRFMEILRRPYYCGAIRIAGWDFANDKGLHQPMITPGEFEEIQAILAGKKHKRPRKNHNPDYPLSKLMECTKCRAKLVGFLQSNGKGATYHRYKCRGCGKMYSRDDVHRALEQLLKRVNLTQRGGASLVKELRAVWKREQQSSVSRIATLAARKSALAEEKSKYLMALAENPDLRDSFRDLVLATEKKILDIDGEMASANGMDADLIDFVKFALKFVERQKVTWWNLAYDEMERCKLLIFPDGFSIDYEKKVHTPTISPLFRLGGYEKEPFRGSNFDMVDLKDESLHPLLEELKRWKKLLEAEYRDHALAHRLRTPLRAGNVPDPSGRTDNTMGTYH